MSETRPRAEDAIVAGPAGPIEALIERPLTETVNAVAVICHPHPLYEGTMHNKVVHTLARAFNALGVTTVRFNFRGVGASAGEYAGGDGEAEDLLAVLDWASARFDPAALWLAGFSFGAAVALRVANLRQISQLVTVAPPVERIDPATLEQPRCPWFVVQGDADELVSADAVVAWLDTLAPGPELTVLEGVDHFFHGRLTELRELVRSVVAPAAATLRGGSAPPG